MGRLPPKDFDAFDPLVGVLPAGSLWYRAHRLDRSPLYFGIGASQRWDAPEGDYGVLYAGEDPECAFLESIGRGLLRTRLVPERMLAERGFSELVLRRELRVMDLMSSGGLARVGAEGSISSGEGYRTSQRWSKAFYEHRAGVDGILYRSRHDPARGAIALFDRASDGVDVAGAAKNWLSDRRLLGRILDLYGFGLE